MKKQFFTLLFFLLPLVVLAQDQFVVYSIKGEVTMTGKRKLVIIKAGDKIPSTNTITIGENSGITMLGNEGAFYSIAKAGTHLLSNYKDSCNKSNSKALNNFMRYLWNLATDKRLKEPGRRRTNYFDHPATIGSSIYPVWINPIAFDTMNYSGIENGFALYWACYCEDKKFEFSLYRPSNIDTPFYKKMVTAEKMPVAELASQITQGNSYYWTVSVPEHEPNDQLFVLNYVTKEVFDAALANIGQQKPLIEGPAEEAYRTAFMLEYFHYPAEAYSWYITAANMAPSNKLYNSTLASFKREFKIDNR